MAEIDIEKRNVVRTIDDLGLEPSIRYAEGEKIRRETEKFIQPGKYGKLPTEKETMEPTPTKSEELFGSTASGRYALFPERPEIISKITALSEGRCASSIGEGNDLMKKVVDAPEELKSNTEEYNLITNFAKQYKETDKDCQDIFGNCRQYNKG